MNTQILQEDFSKSLTLVSRFVSIRAQLPILGNILLCAKKNKLYLSATNLESSITTAIGAKVEKDGDITIPARALTDLITNLPNSQIALAAEKEQLKITTDSFSGKLQGVNSHDFPAVPQSANKDALVIPSETFLRSLNKVCFAASSDESRPVLTGVLFVFEEDQLTLVASDGFRLSQTHIKLTQKAKPAKVIIPKVALMEFLRIISNAKDPVLLEIRQSDNQVVMKVGECVLSSRIIEGLFPDFEKIIPKTTTTKISLDKEDFGKAIKIASVFARDGGNIIKLQVKESEVVVSAESSRVGSQKTTLSARVEGPDIEISYNFKFLEDFANIAVGESVEIDLLNETSPGIFKDPESKDFLHLIMPVKLQS